MKKFFSILLAAILILPLGAQVFAAENSPLSFNSDGTFKIMQINDTQDVGKNVDSRLIEFIEAALDKEQPDLVVFVGDQLADFYPFATKEDMTLAIQNVLNPLKERDIPFLVTLGNHDHDNLDKFSVEEQFAVYASFDNCLAADNGPDNFTYSIPVMSSDGEKIAFNIYMMNTHNKAESGGYAGVNSEQVEWYKETSAQLKAANDGVIVPSILFQHIPPKEIYTLFKESNSKQEGAIYSRRDKKWYVLDENKAQGILGEPPCSENFDNITGQYEAWLECGDIIGAFFAHDHVNTFVGTNEDGITMGYNGGTGFRAYGAGHDRSVRIFNFTENDIENYETHLLTYNELTGEEIKFSFVDTFSPVLFTKLMKVVWFLFGWIID